MNAWSDAFVVAAAFAASALVLATLLRLGLHGALDAPNERSLHSRPVPRSGGLGILAATMLGFAAAQGPWLAGACALALAAVSAADDQLGLPAGVRLLVHLLAAGVFSSVALGPAASWILVVALTLALAWMTNLYNFMDGADGLAGGMGLAGFSAYAYAAAEAGDVQLALVCACVAAGALGFLLFNFHPARIFMGDVGSIPLGFLAGAVGLEGVQRGLWPAWFPLLVFAPFIFDASVTLARRLLRGERVWHAHRSHYYQRMILSGLGHRNTAFIWYALMAAGAAAACVLRDSATSVPVLASIALGYGALAAVVETRCPSERRSYP